MRLAVDIARNVRCLVGLLRAYGILKIPAGARVSVRSRTNTPMQGISIVFHVADSVVDDFDLWLNSSNAIDDCELLFDIVCAFGGSGLWCEATYSGKTIAKLKCAKV